VGRVGIMNPEARVNPVLFNPTPSFSYALESASPNPKVEGPNSQR